MPEEINLDIKDHYENLSCGHQNNLLLTYPGNTKNTPGVCPKGCLGIIKVLRVTKVDVKKANLV